MCSYENLDSANQMNIKLTIPQSNTVHDFQLLAVRSFRHDRTLSTVALPSTLVVPPYLGRAGKSFRPSPTLGMITKFFMPPPRGN